MKITIELTPEQLANLKQLRAQIYGEQSRITVRDIAAAWARLGLTKEIGAAMRAEEIEVD